MAPTAGRIWFDGRDITALPQHVVARLGVAKSYQITNVFPHLSVLENVRVAVQGHRRAYRARELLDTVGLDAKGALLAAHLSHGEKRPGPDPVRGHAAGAAG